MIMKPRMARILFIAILLVAAGAIIGTVTGLISFEDVYTNFIAFVYWLVVLALLAVIGGIFLGMFFSHKFLSQDDFTPFEQEMLKMRKDIQDVKEMMEEHVGKKEE